MQPTTSKNNQLKSDTIKGIKWNLINKVIAQIFSLAFAVVLARLLTPHEFGLVAMVTVILGIIKVIHSFGLGEALIQKEEITETELSSVFWVNVFLGIIFTSIAFLAAPFISKFYQKDILIPITYFFGFTFLLDSFTVVHYALLWRNLEYKKLFFVQLPSIIIAGTVAVVMALNGFGVWSLVTKSLVSIAALLFFLTIASSWTPKFIFNAQAVKNLFGFSLPRVGTLIFSYLIRNLDKIMVGHYLGGAPLGFYEKSYAFMLLPLSNITSVISQVLFPSFSKIQNNHDQIKEMFFKVIRFVAFFTFPLMIGLSIFSEPFVLFLLGEKWSGAIAVLQILAWVGLIQSISGFYQPVYLSQGATQLQFKLDIILKTQSVFWIILGIKWGIEGVAYGILIGVLINQFPYLHFLGKLINMKLLEFFKNLLPVFFVNIAFLLFLLLIYNYVLIAFSPGIKLLLGTVIGGGFYIGICSLLKIKTLQEIYTFALSRLKNSSS